MECPDVLGYKLCDAKNILDEAGYHFEIQFYKAPKSSSTTYSPDSRIIKTITIKNNHIKLIVCDGAILK